jgi:hypothetical protein
MVSARNWGKRDKCQTITGQDRRWSGRQRSTDQLFRTLRMFFCGLYHRKYDRLRICQLLHLQSEFEFHGCLIRQTYFWLIPHGKPTFLSAFHWVSVKSILPLFLVSVLFFSKFCVFPWGFSLLLSLSEIKGKWISTELKFRPGNRDFDAEIGSASDRARIAISVF